MKTTSHLSVEIVLQAMEFAAQKHTEQRRKDRRRSPYINHPIKVAWLLNSVGNITDPRVLVAGILHDTIEDTDATEEELRSIFGDEITDIVLECTDDKSLPKVERKRLQVEKAPNKSSEAKSVKLADKISNVQDLTDSPPPDWPLERVLEYLDWSERVVAGLRGTNSCLEDLYDIALEEARRKISLHLQS